MVKRVTKDLLDKSAIVADDKFPISDSEDLFNPSDPESGQLKRISWGAIQDLLIQNTVTFVVTSDFASWEVINITDWTWAISGTTTRTIWDTGDITSLGSSAAIFNANASLRVTDNKTIVLKGTEVIWDSATTFHFTRALSVWEWFIIEDGSVSWGGTIWDTTVEGNLVVTGTTDLQWDTTVNNIEITWDITKTGSTIWSVVTFVDDSVSWSTINLPTAVGLLNQSFTYIRTDITLNPTTILPNGSETISNVASFILWAWESITLISDDSNWFII